MGCQLHHGNEAAHPDPELRSTIGGNEQRAPTSTVAAMTSCPRESPFDRTSWPTPTSA
jgi:hypothetical protein